MRGLIWVAKGQSAGGYLSNVQQLRRAFAGGCQGIAEHGVAEGAGAGDCRGSGGYQFGGAIVADALAGFFAEEGQAAACAAAKAALAIARGFDEIAGQGCDGAGLVVDIAIAAEIAGVVEDDLLWN